MIKKTVPGAGGAKRKRFIARWKTQDGKQHEKAFDSLREARQHAAAMEAVVQKAQLSDVKERQRSKVLFAECAEQYLATLRSHETQTLKTYRMYMERHVIPWFAFRGGTVGSPSRSDIESFRDHLAAKDLSVRSARECLRLCRAVFDHAVSRDLIEMNPARDVRIRQTRQERTEERLDRDEKFYTTAELKRLLAAADALSRAKHKQTRQAWIAYRALTYFLVHTGVRISEARGFPRSGWDPKNRIVRIRQRADQEGKIGHPKSAEGVRDIPMLDDLIEPMEALLTSHDRELVFSGKSGNAPHLANLRARMFLPLTEKAGVRALGFHALRHSYAARLIEAGVHPKELQTYLGHHDPAFSLKVYGHLIDAEKSREALRARMAL
ncbi:MAG: site-specific integrase [Pseudomonadota bacterium]